MAFPTGWAGYDEITLTNPASALTDFTYLLALSSLSADWKAAADGSGNGIRVTDSSNTQLPVDVIHPYTGGTTGLIAFRFSPASSGTQVIRIWNDEAGESLPAAGDTYGQYNAYASHVKAFYPDGGGNDRTSNANNLTMTGSPSVGGVAGVVNGSLATDYDGSTQYGAASASIPTVPFSFSAIFNTDVVNVDQAIVAICRNPAGTTDQYALQFNNTGDRIVAFSNDAGSVATASTNSTTPAIAVSAGAWYYPTGVWASDSSRFIYANGGTAHNETTTITPDLTDRISIGALFTSAAAGNFFNGKISLAWVHNSALAADWINYRYTMESDANQDAFYTFGSWTANGGGGGTILPIVNSIMLGGVI
jgi:hypothetical protein